jgi:hypothetical protein
MIHPAQEDWMSYLYDEVEPSERAAMKAHIESCAACRCQVMAWQGTREAMNEFALPSRRRPFISPAAARWAMAAAFVGLLAIGIVYVAALRGDIRDLRAEVQGSLRRELESGIRLDLARQMRTDLDQALAGQGRAREQSSEEARALVVALAQHLEALRAADQQATLAALQSLGARQTRDYAALRNELETVAVLTEAGLQRAQNQIATLAYEPASANSSNNN